MADVLTFEQLKSLVTPGGKAAIIQATVDAFNQYAEEYGLNTPMRKSHFLAQLAHESDHFNTTREYGGPSKRYAPWFGRGLIQVTWEENYIDFYEWAVKKGLNPPEFFDSKSRDEVAKFPWAFFGAVWYWQSRKLNDLADEDNIRAITKKINGGYNGLEDRIKYLNKAKKIFKAKANPVDKPEGTITVKNFKVIDVQNALIKLGYRLEADGKNGPKTIAAVKMFQKVNNLVPDGVIGPKTAEVLFK